MTRRKMCWMRTRTPDTLEGLLRGVTQQQAEAARGGDEGWSMVEVLCHLRDAEERTLERTVAIRDEYDPFLPRYDQDDLARDRAYKQADVREALAGLLVFGRNSGGAGGAEQRLEGDMDSTKSREPLRSAT